MENNSSAHFHNHKSLSRAAEEEEVGEFSREVEAIINFGGQRRERKRGRQTW